jgi:hypothetical protein
VSGNRVKRLLLYFTAAIVLLGFAACSEDGDTGFSPQPTAPSLPSLSTMAMDVSFFGVGAVAGSAVEAADPAIRPAVGNKRNWIEAAVRVMYAQLLFYDAFEEPIGAFAAAIHSVPQHQADGSWLWTYIFVEGGIDYGIFLYGKVVDDHVEWRMEVSSTDPAFTLDHFVWLDGHSQRDDRFGYWQFYKPVPPAPASARLYMASMTPGVPSVRVDWQRNGPGDRSLTVVVNEVGSPDEGDALAFHKAPAEHTLDVHDEGLQEDHNVTWYPDGSGSLTVPNYNGGQKACWDTRQEDVACP